MTPRPLALALLAALALPSVAATWTGPGGAEPDTHDDERSGYMWLEPDVGADQALTYVYFDGFAAVVDTVWNPNVGLVGTSLWLPGQVEYRAVLGIWKDCNRDGAIGLAEAAVQDYSSLLADAGVCPPGSQFNDGRWVSELISIGMIDPCEYENDDVRAVDCPGVDAFHVNERVLYANGTAVWADLGAPGTAPAPRCALAPLPYGTTSSTGMMIRYGDCHIGHSFASTLTVVDDELGAGLAFEDEENPQHSGSPLNQATPISVFGDPDRGRTGLAQSGTGRPAATAWDCDAPATATARDPTAAPGQRGALSEVAISDPTGGYLSGRSFPYVIFAGSTGLYFADEDNDASTPGVLRRDVADHEGNYARAPAPAPAIDPHGSAYDAADDALDGVRGDCDPATNSDVGAANPASTIESGAAAVRLEPRSRSDFVFTFYDGHRGFHERIDPHVGETTPSDGGLILRRNGRGGAGPMWNALPSRLQDPQLVDRHTLAPQGPLHVTFYARVGSGTATLGLLPPTGEGTYGAEACPAAGSAAPWVCEPDAWWIDASGNDIMPRYARGEPIGQRPGAAYNLRDVDCFDGQLARGASAYASLALVADSPPCTRPG